jgi:lysophospholipase L1-like esterase
MANPNAVRVAVVGHSYVRRLEEFTRKDKNTVNLGFPVECIMVRFFGLGGGSLESGRRKNLHQLVDSVRHFQPTIIFQHAGENDVTRISPSQILSCLFSFCDDLSSIPSVTAIVVSQLLLFPVLKCHKECVEAVNAAFSSIGSDCMNVDLAYSWKHRIGACGENAAEDVFDDDGVHLTELGLMRYMKSVRAAVSRTVKKVQGRL